MGEFKYKWSEVLGWVQAYFGWSHCHVWQPCPYLHFFGHPRWHRTFFGPKRPENGHDIKFVSDLRMEPKFWDAKRAMLLKWSKVLGVHHVLNFMRWTQQVGQGIAGFWAFFWHERQESSAASPIRNHGQGYQGAMFYGLTQSSEFEGVGCITHYSWKRCNICSRGFVNLCEVVINSQFELT